MVSTVGLWEGKDPSGSANQWTVIKLQFHISDSLKAFYISSPVLSASFHYDFHYGASFLDGPGDQSQKYIVPRIFNSL